MSGKNKELIAGSPVIVLPLIAGLLLVLKGAESGGSGDAGNVMVEKITREYEPWFIPVLEILTNGELSGEIESLLSRVQTGIGVGTLVPCMGCLAKQKKWTDRESKMIAQDGHKNIIFRLPMVWSIYVNRLIQKDADVLKS